MQIYLCKVYVFNISKTDIFGKNAWFSGNTPFYWNNTSRCSDHTWGEGGKVQYITKQKEKNVLALASGSFIRQKIG